MERDLSLAVPAELAAERRFHVVHGEPGVEREIVSAPRGLTAPADGKPHIPIRDSTLTRILQQSLGGNCKTALMVAVSPHSDNEAETMSSLRFGQRAKTIKTVVKMNEQKSAEALEAIVEHLR